MHLDIIGNNIWSLLLGVLDNSKKSSLAREFMNHNILNDTRNWASFADKIDEVAARKYNTSLGRAITILVSSWIYPRAVCRDCTRS